MLNSEEKIRELNFIVSDYEVIQLVFKVFILNLERIKYYENCFAKILE